MTLEIAASGIQGSIQRHDLPDASPTVSIKNHLKIPAYTEPAEIDRGIVNQAQEIGELLVPIAENMPSHISDQSFRDSIGMSENYYNLAVKPFIHSENRIDVFGVDSVIDQDSNSIKFIEINSRPQFLGRFDHFNSQAVGDGPNSHAYRVLEDTLEAENKGGACLVISHPLNAFHNYHRLLAQQMGVPVVSLQDLETDDKGFVTWNKKRVGVAFRQFSTKSFLNTSITQESVIRAIQEGKIALVNGPLTGRLGEKAFLARLSQIDPRISKYLPEMKSITTGDGTNLKDYEGWWLKTTTGGQTELTLRLTRKNLTGWVGGVIRHLVAGNLDAAQRLVEDKNGNPTADRFCTHISDLRNEHSVRWILQKHVESTKIEYNDPQEGPLDLNTTLRIYFIRFPGDKGKPKVFLEMLASKYDRVSAAGLTIPLKY